MQSLRPRPSSPSLPVRPATAVAAAVALVFCLLACGAAPASGGDRDAQDAPISVRFPEGTAHGFLELHSETGALLAHGDLLQRARAGGMESRMVFHFAESVFEET